MDLPATPTLTALAGTDPASGRGRIAIAVQAHDNILSAGDASQEGSIGTWAARSNCTVARSNATAEDGSYSLQITPAGGGICVCSTTLGTSGYGVLGSTSYVISGDFKAGTTQRSCYVAVKWYDVNGTLLREDLGPAVTDSTVGWSRSAFTVTSPANAAYATAEGQIVGATNMLSAVDASFETGVGLWVGVVNCGISSSTDHALDGTHSLKMLSTAAGDMAAQIRGGTGLSVYPVTTGVSYTAAASFLAGATPRGVRLDFQWFTSGGGFISDSAGPVFADNTVAWTEATLTATAPPTAAGVQVKLTVLATGAANEAHYADKVGLFATATPSTWTGINPTLLNNGDFEQDTSGWSVFAGGWTIARSTAQAFTGLASLNASGGTGGALLNQPTVVAGTTYTASAWVYVPAGSSAVSLILIDPNGSTNSNTATTTVTNAWQRLVVTLTAVTSGTSSLEFRPATTGQFYVDGVKLEVGSSATQFVPPSYSNLITNPSFEDGGTGGWAALNSFTLSNSTAQAKYGTRSLQITAPTPPPGGGPTQLAVSLAVGQTYTASVWAYMPTLFAPGGVKLYYFDTTAGEIDSTLTTIVGSWVQLTLTFTPQSTSSQVIGIGISGNPALGNVLYLDGVQLEIGHQANPYIDGSMTGGSWDAASNLFTAAQASFEDGSTGGWSPNGCAVANSTTQAKDGTHSLKNTGTSISAGSLMSFSASIPAVVGTTYTASLWIFSATAATFYLELNDTLGSQTGPQVAVAANTWTRLVVTAPFRGGATVSVGLLTATTIATCTVYVDAVQLEQRSYATAYGQTGTANASSSTYSYPWDVSGDLHYLDEMRIAPGSDTTAPWTPGGLAGSTTVTVLRSDGLYVRGASAVSPTGIPTPGQGVTIYDFEATPGVSYTYTAVVSAAVLGSTISSAASPPTAAVSLPAPAAQVGAADTGLLFQTLGWAADQDISGQLYKWLDGIGELLQTIDNLCRDDPAGWPGWSVVLDLYRCPTYALPWLGQLVGVRVDPTQSDAAQRIAIQNEVSWTRGTPAALRTVAQQFLTGAKTVNITERDTSPYHLGIQVFQSQIEGMTYGQLSATYAKYSDLTAAFSTYAAYAAANAALVNALNAALPAGLVLTVTIS